MQNGQKSPEIRRGSFVFLFANDTLPNIPFVKRHMTRDKFLIAAYKILAKSNDKEQDIPLVFDFLKWLEKTKIITKNYGDNIEFHDTERFCHGTYYRFLEKYLYDHAPSFNLGLREIEITYFFNKFPEIFIDKEKEDEAIDNFFLCLLDKESKKENPRLKVEDFFFYDEELRKMQEEENMKAQTEHHDELDALTGAVGAINGAEEKTKPIKNTIQHDFNGHGDLISKPAIPDL